MSAPRNTYIQNPLEYLTDVDYELLIHAAKLRYLSVVRHIVGQRIAGVYTDFDVVLRWASSKGDLVIVKYVIEHLNPDIHVCDQALIIAAERDHLSVVKYLIEKYKADFYVDNYKPLRSAAERGHLSIVQYLIEKYKADVNARDQAFISAVVNGHLQVVTYLIKQGADIHAVNDADLISAAHDGHISVVQYLINADVNASAVASDKEHLSVITYLRNYIKTRSI